MMRWISGRTHDATLIPVSFKFGFKKAIAVSCWLLVVGCWLLVVGWLVGWLVFGVWRRRFNGEESKVESDHCVNYICPYILLDSTLSLTVRFPSCRNDNFYRYLGAGTCSSHHGPWFISMIISTKTVLLSLVDWTV
ncbi:unnamed protein product [Ambrosiozyma monospora]|uniref:Unnamed protein product n=1 Tax=Ambrosiozyma monospora TaxID=43982 RepID=A0A9W6Z6Q8_AMBMO|nr:unnamed protein product [Ambrosiozyma monospora]